MQRFSRLPNSYSNLAAISQVISRLPIVQKPDFPLCQRLAQAGISLAVWWLRLHASIAGVTVSIPGRGTKILQAAWHSQKKKGIAQADYRIACSQAEPPQFLLRVSEMRSPSLHDVLQNPSTHHSTGQQLSSVDKFGKRVGRDTLPFLRSLLSANKPKAMCAAHLDPDWDKPNVKDIFETVWEV